MLWLAAATIQSSFLPKIFKLPWAKCHTITKPSRFTPTLGIINSRREPGLLWSLIGRERLNSIVQLARVATIHLHLLVRWHIHVLLGSCGGLVVVRSDVAVEILVYLLRRLGADGLLGFKGLRGKHVDWSTYLLGLLLENRPGLEVTSECSSELDRVVYPWLLFSEVDINLRLLIKDVRLCVSIISIPGRWIPWATSGNPWGRFHNSIWVSRSIRAQRWLLLWINLALRENTCRTLTWLSGRLNSLDLFNC